jgi:hypothetical protein
MTNLTIIDTDILIDTSRNKSEAIDYLQNLQRRAIQHLSHYKMNIQIARNLLQGCSLSTETLRDPPQSPLKRGKKII